MKNNTVLSLLIIPAFLAATAAGAAPVTFQALCVDPADCDGDAAFSMLVTVDDSVIVPGGTYVSRDEEGFDVFESFSFSLTSSVGDGFSLSGGITDLVQTGGGLILAFDAVGTLISMLDHVSGDFFFGASNAGPGQLWFRGDEILSRRDNTPEVVSDVTRIRVAFEEVPAPVPLPAGGPLLIGALGALGLLQRRRA